VRIEKRPGGHPIYCSLNERPPQPRCDSFEQHFLIPPVDWQVTMFGGAVHSFCDPTASAGPTRYDEKLCRKSYMLMRDFFAETL
jgi:dienelactone hydrolase